MYFVQFPTGPMATDNYLGEFEHLVMLALLRLGDDAYGVTILNTIEERAGRSVSFGAVYSTLRRLARRGYVSSRLGEPEPVRGGRAKKFFELTDPGVRALQRSQARLAKMSEGLEAVESLPRR